jgi:hypothetical protein
MANLIQIKRSSTATNVPGSLAQGELAINTQDEKLFYANAATTVKTVDLTTLGSALQNIVEDTTPQLGGNLDLNGNVITGLEIGTDVQAWSAVLDATTASFLVADETKLDGIEALADVTDTANVTAAGALMDSEVDADIKTLVLPANTTISTFGASLVDDADASAGRTTLGLGSIAVLNEISEGDLDAALTAKINNQAFNKFDATTAPDANDDSANTSGDGVFEVGSTWIDTVADKAYRCVDATATAAIWIETTLTTSDLGTMAVQNSNSVSITGGSVTGITDMALADGGTGADLSAAAAGSIFKLNAGQTALEAATAGTDYLNDASTIDGGSF